MARPWEIPDLSPDLHLDEAARRVILVRFEQMAVYREAVIQDTDIEDLHDMRVASRRLRAAWRCFGPLFSGKPTRRFQKEAGLITRTLGVVRDLDVMLEDLEDAEAEAPEFIQAGFEHLLEYVHALRMQAFEPMCQTLYHWHPHLFLEYFPQAPIHEWAHHFRFYEQAHLILSELVEAYLSYQDYLNDPAAIEHHHAMRIEGKRLRYALEIFSCCVEHAKHLLGTLQDVQEDLGDLHDRDVMIAFFEQRQQFCFSIEKPALVWLTEYHRQRREAAYQHMLASWQHAMNEDFEEYLRRL